MLNIVPDENDIQEEDAIRLAAQKVSDKYGVSAEQVLACRVIDQFWLRSSGQRVYSILFFPEEGSRIAGGYDVRFLSPGGETEHIWWMLNEAERTLPEGELSLYPDAVREYVSMGVFDDLPAADKASAAARIQKAGLNELLPERQYLSPGAGDLPETEAAALAKKEAAERWGMDERTLTMFHETQALVLQDASRAWKITWSPSHMDDALGDRNLEAAQKVGSYTVLLDARSGVVLSAEWSLADKAAKQVYTPKTKRRGKGSRPNPQECLQCLAAGTEGTTTS